MEPLSLSYASVCPTSFHLHSSPRSAYGSPALPHFQLAFPNPRAIPRWHHSPILWLVQQRSPQLTRPAALFSLDAGWGGVGSSNADEPDVGIGLRQWLNQVHWEGVALPAGLGVVVAVVAARQRAWLIFPFSGLMILLAYTAFRCQGGRLNGRAAATPMSLPLSVHAARISMDLRGTLASAGLIAVVRSAVRRLHMYSNHFVAIIVGVFFLKKQTQLTGNDALNGLSFKALLNSIMPEKWGNNVLKRDFPLSDSIARDDRESCLLPSDFEAESTQLNLVLSDVVRYIYKLEVMIGKKQRPPTIDDIVLSEIEETLDLLKGLISTLSVRMGRDNLLHSNAEPTIAQLNKQPLEVLQSYPGHSSLLVGTAAEPKKQETLEARALTKESEAKDSGLNVPDLKQSDSEGMSFTALDSLPVPCGEDFSQGKLLGAELKGEAALEASIQAGDVTALSLSSRTGGRDTVRQLVNGRAVPGSDAALMLPAYSSQQRQISNASFVDPSKPDSTLLQSPYNDSKVIARDVLHHDSELEHTMAVNNSKIASGEPESSQCKNDMASSVFPSDVLDDICPPHARAWNGNDLLWKEEKEGLPQASQEKRDMIHFLDQDGLEGSSDFPRGSLEENSGEYYGKSSRSREELVAEAGQAQGGDDHRESKLDGGERNWWPDEVENGGRLYRAECARGSATAIAGDFDKGRVFNEGKEASNKSGYGDVSGKETALFESENVSRGKLGAKRPQQAKQGQSAFEIEGVKDGSLESAESRDGEIRFGSKPSGSRDQIDSYKKPVKSLQDRLDPKDERISWRETRQSSVKKEVTMSMYQRGSTGQGSTGASSRASNQQGSSSPTFLPDPRKQVGTTEQNLGSIQQSLGKDEVQTSSSDLKQQVGMTGQNLPGLRKRSDRKQGGEFRRLMDEGEALFNEGRQGLDGKIEVGVAECMLYEAADLFASAAAMDPSSVEAVGFWGNTLLVHGELKLKLSKELRTMLPSADLPSSYGSSRRGMIEEEWTRKETEQAAIEQTLQVICEECEELLVEAGRKYRMALSMNRSDTRALYNWGLALCFRAQLIVEERGQNAAENADKVYLAAIDKFEAMMGISQAYAPGAMLNWGLALRDRSRLRPMGSKERMKLLQQAKQLFQDALRFDPNHGQIRGAVATCSVELKELQKYKEAQSGGAQRSKPGNW